MQDYYLPKQVWELRYMLQRVYPDRNFRYMNKKELECEYKRAMQRRVSV